MNAALIRLPGIRLIAGVMLALAVTAAIADDITNTRNVICYGWSASVCDAEQGCQETEAWRLDLPDFVRVDLREGLARTTEAGPQQRETQFETVERANGTIVMHGAQADRAFSWLIIESSGEGTLTISAPGQGITVFTVCTPD